MNQLNPAESYPIVRVLKDHTDSGTYYVQAIVRDATTDVLLATVNLTDRGSRRFSTAYKIPYDNVNARGRFILITSTVYTDAGYTLKSDNHNEESETYVVQERFNNHAQFGGGGVEIDYEKIRKMVDTILDEKLKPLTDLEPIVFPEAPLPIDYTPAIKEISAKIDNLPKPVTPEKIDLQPLFRLIAGVQSEIKTLPRFETTNLTPVTDEIRTVGSLVEAMDSQHQIDMTTMLEMQVQANEENAKLSEFTNGNGARMQLKVSDTEQSKKELVLKRLALKHRL